MMYRLFIGANNATGLVDQEKAVAFLSTLFDGMTLYPSKGFWKGQAENSLVIEIETLTQADAMHGYVDELRTLLCQQSIGMQILPSIEFIG